MNTSNLPFQIRPTGSGKKSWIGSFRRETTGRLCTESECTSGRGLSSYGGGAYRAGSISLKRCMSSLIDRIVGIGRIVGLTFCDAFVAGVSKIGVAFVTGGESDWVLCRGPFVVASFMDESSSFAPEAAGACATLVLLTCLYPTPSWGSWSTPPVMDPSKLGGFMLERSDEKSTPSGT